MSKDNLIPPSKEFLEKWKDNTGQWSDPDKANAAREKGLETRRKNKLMREKLKDKQKFIEDALVAATADTPDFMKNIIDSLLSVINSDATDAKDKLAALDRLTQITGLQAPKQTEAKIETKEMSPEEATAILNSFKVIDGGKS